MNWRDIKMAYSNRSEIKYIVDIETFSRMKKDIDPFFEYDKKGGDNGKYIVSSIYYDSSDLRFYTEKIDGEKVRNKIRIRVYLDFKGKHRLIDLGELRSKNKILLEIKKRNNTNIVKNKLLMFEDEAQKFLKNPSFIDIERYSEEERCILSNIAYINSTYNLRPIVVIQYIRQAFLTKSFPRVRLTFDTILKCRSKNFYVHDLNLGNYFLEPSLGILEIKYNTSFPTWLSTLVKKYNLSQVTFSKYCTAIESIVNKNKYFINRSYSIQF